MIDWILGVIVIIIYIYVRMSYKKKYNFIVTNNIIKFNLNESSKSNKITEIILFIMIIINILFFNSDDVFTIGIIFIMMPLSFYKSKFIVHSGGILIQGQEYRSKDILSYQVMKLSKTHIRFRILINEGNKKRYKSIPMKNEYEEEVIKALDELISEKYTSTIIKN